MKNFIVLSFFFLPVVDTSAQYLLTEAEAIRLSLNNSPALQAADIKVQQSEQLLKSAVNIPNPEVMTESPTGEFYTTGVQQTMDFPTVYLQQRKLALEKTMLAQQEQVLSQSEIKYRIRSFYLNAQYLQELQKQLRLQDSLYGVISAAATEKYNAGSIDLIEKTFTELQYVQIHSLYLDAVADYSASIAQLQLYTNMTHSFQVAPLQKLPSVWPHANFFPDSLALMQNLRLKYFAQQVAVSKRSLRLEQQRMLPGITFGYINQGALYTPTFYRFRIGITLPVWFWQYTGNIRAAKYEVRIAQQQHYARQQQLTSELITAQSTVFKTLQNLNYLETSALANAGAAINASLKYFTAGETGYSEHLRTMNDAYQVYRMHIDAVRNYNQAVIHLSYLNGN